MVGDEKKKGGFVGKVYSVMWYIVVLFISSKYFFPELSFDHIKIIPILYKISIIFYYGLVTLTTVVAIPAAYIMNKIAYSNDYDSDKKKIKFTAGFTGPAQDSKFVMWVKRIWNWIISIYAILLFSQTGYIYACILSIIMFITSCFILSVSKELKTKIAILTLAGDIE